MGRAVPNSMKKQLPKECCNCGSMHDLEYHHIVPWELGGETKLSNIAVICSTCHRKIHLGNVSEINHGALIKEGQRKARERGAHIGRFPANHENVMRLIAENSTQFNADSLTTEHEIMEMAGVKEVCYSKCKRELFEAMDAEDWPYSWPKPTKVRKTPLYDSFIKRKRGAAT